MITDFCSKILPPLWKFCTKCDLEEKLITWLFMPTNQRQKKKIFTSGTTAWYQQRKGLNTHEGTLSSCNSRHSPIAGVPDQLCFRPWAWGIHPDPSPEESVGGTCTSHQSLPCQWQQTPGENLHLSACTAPALRWTLPARLCPELTIQQQSMEMLTHVCTDYSTTHNETQTVGCLCKVMSEQWGFILWSSGLWHCEVWQVNTNTLEEHTMEDEGSMFLRNIHTDIPNCTVMRNNMKSIGLLTEYKITGSQNYHVLFNAWKWFQTRFMDRITI